MPASAESSDAIATHYQYDMRGRLERIIENYDNGMDDEMVGVVDVDVITRFHYDPVGNIIGVTDPLGRSVSYEYDLVDRPIRITEPNPGGGAATPVTFLAYDGLGRLIRERDPRGTLTRYEYDQRHRLTRVSTVLANSEEPIANSQ